MNENLFADLYDTDEEEKSVAPPVTEADTPPPDNSALFSDLYDTEKPSVSEPVAVETEQPETTEIENTLLADLYEDENVAITGQDSTEYDLSIEKSFDEFASDQGYIDSIEEYAIARYGKKGAQGDDETNSDYLERFLTEVRAFETNSLNLTSTLDWVRGATEEEKQNFGYIYSQLEKMPGFFSEGGGSTLRGIRDYVGYFISDPINLVGFGAGRVAASGAKAAILQTFKEKGKQAAIEQAAKLSLQAAKKPLAVELSADLVTGTVEDLGRQEIESEVGLREDVSVGQAIVVGGMSAMAGGVLTTAVTAATARKGAKEIIEDVEQISERVAKRAAERETAEQVESGYVFDPINGYDVLEEIDLKTLRGQVEGGELTEGQLQVEITQRIAKVATEAVAEMMDKGELPAQIRKMIDDGDRASSIARVVLSNENIDSDILSGAISRAGMSVEDFLDVSGVSLSDAARTMQSYSNMGKLIKRVNQLDPKVAEIIQQKFGKTDATTSAFSKAHDFMMRLDRERRAFMVSQIATTARNVATAGMRLGMEGAARTMESTLFQLGKGIRSVASGNISAAGTYRGVREILNDGFGVLAYLSDVGGSKELADTLLKHNPRLSRIMDRSLQEVDVDQSLSRPARWVNTLNILQDTYFRRAVFNESVHKQLRSAGVDLDEFLLTGKALPTDVLERAVDEALSFTFARMPKRGGDKLGDTVGYHFIRINESFGPLPGLVNLPVGTGAFPFARFMVNAMQFQLDYSPLSTVGAITNGSKGLYAKYVKGVSNATTERQLADAREQIGKATVGTAALFAAIKHREENQNTRWYEVEDSEGRTIDTRPFFPISPYLAVADFIVKMKNDQLDEAGVTQVLEGLTGAQLRAGASAYMVDSFFQNLDSITGDGGVADIKAEKFAEYISGYLGELVGSFTTPAKVVSDVMAQFDKEEAYIRDSRQIDGIGPIDRGVDAFTKAATRGLPSFLRKELPIKESPTQEAPMMKQSPLYGQLTGVRPMARRTAIQKELIDLGYEDYMVVKSTGDKKADAFVKKHMGKLVENRLAKEIDSDYYRGLSDKEKKATMKNKLERFRRLAKEIGKVEAMTVREDDTAFSPFDRAEWARLSGVQRKLADEYYEDRYGMSVMAMQEADPDTNHFKIGKLIGQGLSRTLQ